MNEMIERAARSLAEKHYMARFEKPATDGQFQMNVSVNWDTFVDDARCVIESIREPTANMDEEGLHVMRQNGLVEAEGGAAAICWKAMIDEALK